MKFTLIAALLAALSLTSCNENQQAQEPQDKQPVVSKPRGWDKLANAQPQYSPNVSAAQQSQMGNRDLNIGAMTVDPNARNAAANEPQIQIPPDAKWTLYCASLKGADRFARANQLKSYLIANTPYKNWYLVHGDSDTTLFYGFYPAIDRSEAGAGRAHMDRKAISEWVDPSTKGTPKEERPFALCFFTPITPADPVAPAQWNLINAPADTVWSLQIMAFHDNPKRKEAAVEAVRELREKYPAQQFYYYHGDSVSSVCVGAWPVTALREQEQDGSSAYESGVREEDAVLVTNMQLPKRYNKVLKDADGRRVKGYSQRVEISDKSLQAAMDQFPYHAINYEVKEKLVRGADGKPHSVAPATFLVKIPREAPSVLSNTNQQQPGGINALVNPTGANNGTSRQQPAGSGTLRRIDR
jgi:hypothetical protein